MVDPKAIQTVLSQILPTIAAHSSRTKQPFVLGVSGLQGSGKTTWAATLAKQLNADYKLATRIISLDDFYLDHDDVVSLRKVHPKNQLLRTRGQPGTHDEKLAQDFFNAIMLTGQYGNYGSQIKWPVYDKSLHRGQGGRVPVEFWESIPLSKRLDVLIFEGWCLGFQPLSTEEVTERWRKCRLVNNTDSSLSTLRNHELEHLLLINENLRRYCDIFLGPWRYDSFLHLGTDDLNYTYTWRLEQESAMRRQGKTSMCDEDTVRFVQGYMPSYELYLDRLNNHSIFENDGDEGHKKHIRVMLDSKRNVISIESI